MYTLLIVKMCKLPALIKCGSPADCPPSIFLTQMTTLGLASLPHFIPTLSFYCGLYRYHNSTYNIMYSYIAEMKIDTHFCKYIRTAGTCICNLKTSIMYYTDYS